MSHELGSAALRDLREQKARENDPERLRELVLNISVLLNMIEDQGAHLEEDRQFPKDHCPPISPLSLPCISPSPILPPRSKRAGRV
jgi:hypothetical protein